MTTLGMMQQGYVIRASLQLAEDVEWYTQEWVTGVITTEPYMFAYAVSTIQRTLLQSAFAPVELHKRMARHIRWDVLEMQR